jgi:hypothetical protein
MSEIVVIHLETDLNEFTSTVTDGGDLSQSAGAALAGTSGGMSVLIDDTTAIYGTKTVYTTAGKLRYRFYVDVNTLTMANNDNFWIFRASGSPGDTSVIKLYKVGSNYQLVFQYVADAGNVDTAKQTITDEPHYIEAYLVRAATDVSADGTSQWWIDGTSIGSQITGIDNYHQFANVTSIKLGAVAGIDAGTSGTFYLDELVVNDDGGVIGPFRRSTTSSKTAYLVGQSIGTSSKNAYLQGQSSTTSSALAFLEGKSAATDTSDSVIAYLIGELGSLSSTLAYLSGSSVSISSNTVYLKGSATGTSNKPAYLKGSSITSSSKSANLPKVPWWYASTLTVNTGMVESGVLSLTYNHIVGGADELVLGEVIGNPGFSYDFTFGDEDPLTDTKYSIHIHGYYEGNPAHVVKLQQKNYTTGLFDNITGNAKDIPNATSEQLYEFFLLHDAKYYSGGKTIVRFIHTSNGSAGHHLHINHMDLHLDVMFGNKPAYLTGIDTAKSNKPAYLCGSTNITSNNIAYLKGSISVTSNKPSFLHGSGDLHSEPPCIKSAYLSGQDTTKSNQVAYLCGELSTTNQSPSYLCGQSLTSDSSSVYLSSGITETSNKPSYLSGIDIAQSRISAFLSSLNIASGYGIGYLAGIDTTKESINAFLAGGLIVTSSESVYLVGKIDALSSTYAYIVGQDVSTSSSPAYIEGYPSEVSTLSSVSVYLVGLSSGNVSSIAAYLSGQSSTSSSNSVFTNGSQNVNSVIHVYINGISTNTSVVSAYIVGQSIISSSKYSYLNGQAETSSNKSAYTCGLNTSDNRIIAYDTFNRTDSTDMGETLISGPSGEPLTQFTWHEHNFYISGNKVSSSPTLDDEIFQDPGLEGTYTNGLEQYLSVAYGTAIENTTDQRNGLKCQQLHPTAGVDNNWIYIQHAGYWSGTKVDFELPANKWYQFACWTKRINPTGTNIHGMFPRMGFVHPYSPQEYLDWSTYTYRANIQRRTEEPTDYGRMAFGFINALSWQTDDWVVDDISIKELLPSSLFSVIDVGESNVVVSATVNGSYDDSGLVLCLDNPDDPKNFIVAYISYEFGTNNFIWVEKCVNGTYTTIVPRTTITGTNATMVLSKSGNRVSVSYNGVNRGSAIVNDAGIINNTYHGLFNVSSNNTLDTLVIKSFDTRKHAFTEGINPLPSGYRGIIETFDRETQIPLSQEWDNAWSSNGYNLVDGKLVLTSADNGTGQAWHAPFGTSGVEFYIDVVSYTVGACYFDLYFGMQNKASWTGNYFDIWFSRDHITIWWTGISSTIILPTPEHPIEKLWAHLAPDKYLSVLIYYNGDWHQQYYGLTPYNGSGYFELDAYANSYTPTQELILDNLGGGNLDGSISSRRRAYISGGSQTNDSQTVYLEGTIRSGTPVYLTGEAVVTDSAQAYLEGLVGSTSSISGYMCGETSATDNAHGYIRGTSLIYEKMSVKLAGSMIVQYNLLGSFESKVYLRGSV